MVAEVINMPFKVKMTNENCSPENLFMSQICSPFYVENVSQKNPTPTLKKVRLGLGFSGYTPLPKYLKSDNVICERPHSPPHM